MESRELENRNRKKEARILNNALVYGRGNCRGELKNIRRNKRKNRRRNKRKNKGGAGDSIVFLVARHPLPFSLYLLRCCFHFVRYTHINSSSCNTSWQSATAQSTFFSIGKDQKKPKVQGVQLTIVFALFRRRWPWLSTFTHESIKKPADHHFLYRVCDCVDLV